MPPTYEKAHPRFRAHYADINTDKQSFVRRVSDFGAFFFVPWGKKGNGKWEMGKFCGAAEGARMLSAACLERDNSVWKNCGGFSHLAKIYVDQKGVCVCVCERVLKLPAKEGKFTSQTGNPFTTRGSPHFPAHNLGIIRLPLAVSWPTDITLQVAPKKKPQGNFSKFSVFAQTINLC